MLRSSFVGFISRTLEMLVALSFVRAFHLALGATTVERSVVHGVNVEIWLKDGVPTAIQCDSADYGHSLYLNLTDDILQGAANAQCQQRFDNDSSLVSVADQSEDEAIRNLTSLCLKTLADSGAVNVSHRVWIGAHCDSEEKQWLWYDDSPFSYDSLGAQSSSCGCVALDSLQQLWAVLQCDSDSSSSINGYICQNFDLFVITTTEEEEEDGGKDRSEVPAMVGIIAVGSLLVCVCLVTSVFGCRQWRRRRVRKREEAESGVKIIPMIQKMKSSTDSMEENINRLPSPRSQVKGKAKEVVKLRSGSEKKVPLRVIHPMVAQSPALREAMGVSALFSEVHEDADESDEYITPKGPSKRKASPRRDLRQEAESGGGDLRGQFLEQPTGVSELFVLEDDDVDDEYKGKGKAKKVALARASPKASPKRKPKPPPRPAPVTSSIEDVGVSELFILSDEVGEVGGEVMGECQSVVEGSGRKVGESHKVSSQMQSSFEKAFRKSAAEKLPTFAKPVIVEKPPVFFDPSFVSSRTLDSIALVDAFDPHKSPIASWSRVQVSQWLQSREHLSHYAQLTLELGVDGKELLRMDRNALAHIGISNFTHQSLLLRAIQQLELFQASQIGADPSTILIRI